MSPGLLPDGRQANLLLVSPEAAGASPDELHLYTVTRTNYAIKLATLRRESGEISFEQPPADAEAASHAARVQTLLILLRQGVRPDRTWSSYSNWFDHYQYHLEHTAGDNCLAALIIKEGLLTFDEHKDDHARSRTYDFADDPENYLAKRGQLAEETKRRLYEALYFPSLQPNPYPDSHLWELVSGNVKAAARTINPQKQRILQSFNIEERLSEATGDPTTPATEALFYVLYRLVQESTEFTGIAKGIKIGQSVGDAELKAEIVHNDGMYQVLLYARPAAMGSEPLKLIARLDTSVVLSDASLTTRSPEWVDILLKLQPKK